MIERMDLEPLTMGDCTKASRKISVLLDVEDPIEGSYNLEVTSPGLDRPLTKAADYKRFIGEFIKVQLHHGLDNRRNFSGVLINADDHGCELEVQNNQDHHRLQLAFSNIAQARLEPEMDFKKLIKSKNKATKQ